MTRTFLALGMKCGSRGRSPSRRSESRATPLRPVPPKRKKSRRLSSQRPALDRRLEDIDKFVGVKERAAEQREAVFADELFGGSKFRRGWRTIEGKFEGSRGRLPSLAFEAFGEQFGLLD